MAFVMRALNSTLALTEVVESVCDGLKCPYPNGHTNEWSTLL